MFTQVKLLLKSYKPLKLENGMWFLAMHHGQMSVYELGYDIHNEEQTETYLQLNGYPVEPYLYLVGNPNIPDETSLMAEPDQIGWFDEDENSDEMHDITLKEINNILDNDGWCLLEVEEEHLDDDEAEDYIRIVPTLLEGKVTIRYIYNDNDDNDDEDDEEDNEEYYDDDVLCVHCNGSGEGMYDGTTCSMCGGSGVIDEDDDRDEPDWDYYPHYNH